MPQNVQASAKVKKPLAAKKSIQQAAETSDRVASKPSATPAKVAPVKVAVKPTAKGAAKEIKPPKQKLVRDSFTFPQAEYLLLVGMKKRLLDAGTDAKKGELVRAGISLLARLDDAALAKALLTVEKLKTGRPAK